MNKQKQTIFGIDLGTTYSCISYVDEYGKAVIIPNKEHQLTTPSVVLFEGEQRIVGEEARSSSLVSPEAVVEMIKRHMGEPNWRFSYEGQEYTPEEISSYILRKIAADAGEALSIPVQDVVITCPAYFGIAQREATARAGELAGLTVHEIINEPTAAAITYGLQNEQDQVVLVYDLGGGTFDVTIIEIKANTITVVATGGDHNLGGRNWDEALVIYLAQQWQAETGSLEDPVEVPETLQDLWIKAERAKRTLSSRRWTKVVVSHAGQVLKVPVTRDKFDALTASLLDRTILFTRMTLEEAQKRGYKQVDQILLVGGSTKMPQVAERLECEFRIPPRFFDPDEAVAKGAAIYGQKLLLDQRVQDKVAAMKKKEAPRAAEAKTKQDQAPASKTQETARSAPEIKETIRLVPETQATASPAAVKEEWQPVEANVAIPGWAMKQQAQADVAQDLGLREEAVERLTNTTITNVTSHSFGVIVTIDPRTSRSREVIENLVLVNDALPARYIKTYGTLEADQETVELRIMENTEQTKIVEPDSYTEDQEIGQVILPLPPGLPANAPIAVSFELDQQGRLHVIGREPYSGTTADALFETRGGMTAEELHTARSRATNITIL